jgi:hypothetical protein
MANRQRRIFIKTVNKLQQLARLTNIGLQPLVRKNGSENTPMSDANYVRIVDFGLSLTIAAHYDKGAIRVFPRVLDACRRVGVRGYGESDARNP